ncbi:EamA family transporter [Bosea sp. ANAM02]|uniref:DMT family transporter n=1 Tax=Bosea sp. ANAM02 TaxID=2020412 RepID=UPI00140F01DA|nr:EamA family transporter [Bosea sp. ANAM02]BCB20310.1 membrane protein [Bosea sp. ANAM02]
MSTRTLDRSAAAPNRAVELALLLVLAGLWGGSYTFIKLGVETIPPLTLIAARTLIAGLVLLAVIRWRGLRLPRDPATWRLFVVQACLNSVVPFTLIAWAERSVDAGLATILSSTSPIFVVLLICLSAKAERLPALRLAGIAAGLAGTVLIVGMQAMAGFGEQLWAQLALVAASICYGGAALFGRSFKGLDPIMPAAGSLLCGALVLLPLSLVLDRPWTLSPSVQSIQALIALSLVSTALAFVIYFRLIARLGAVATTSVAYLRVPTGVLIGMIFLGEALAPTAWAGLGLVILGVMAMTLPLRSRAPAG